MKCWKTLKILLLLGTFSFGLIFLLLFKNFSLISAFSFNQTQINLEEFQKEGEKLLEEILSYYKKGNYGKVKALAEKLPSSFILRPEENLILMESFLKVGDPEKSLLLANKVITVKRGTREACLAESFSIKALLVLERFPEAQVRITKFLDSYCEEDLKTEMRMWDKFLKKYSWERWSSEEIELWKKTGLDIYKWRILYLIQKKQLEKAEKEISYYLNVSGRYSEGEELFFKLAEAYFKIGKRDQAKKFYELVITEWDATPSALFSKFRLYQIVYERTPIKKLLPHQTIKDLLFYISQIKSKYPEEDIAEEAHLLEIKIYSEEKDYEKAYLTSSEFINKYKKSIFLSEVWQSFCQNFAQYLNLKIEKEELIEVFDLERKNKEYIEKSKCGEVYYLIGNIFWNYQILTLASQFYLKSWDQGISKNLEPTLYFRLAFLAKETGEEEIFKNLFKIIENKYVSLLKEEPLYTYLKFFYELEKNVFLAEKYLLELINSSVDQRLKEKALVKMWERFLFLKKYEKALDYLNNPYFPLQVENLIILLSETFEYNPKLFPKVLELAKKKFPNHPQIKWLEAYFLEREGEIEKALALWKELTESSGLEAELAKSYQRWQELVEKSRKIAF